jgi:hypothetical protein
VNRLKKGMQIGLDDLFIYLFGSKGKKTISYPATGSFLSWLAWWQGQLGAISTSKWGLKSPPICASLRMVSDGYGTLGQFTTLDLQDFVSFCIGMSVTVAISRRSKAVDLGSFEPQAQGKFTFQSCCLSEKKHVFWSISPLSQPFKSIF